jgi:large subunit ribosomal protein L4
MATQKSAETHKASKSIAHVIAPQDLQLTHEQEVDVMPASVAQYMRVLRQNWRQGTVSSKGRSDVSFSNKKPWKQKGTGRARAGSARSPLWRKGGVTFGPQQRTRTLAVSKELKRHVCNNLFWHYLKAQQIVSLQWALEQDTPKTALAHKALKSAGLDTKKILMFVKGNDLTTYASFVNIPNIQLLLFDQPNAYDLANSEYWVFLNKDIDAFKEMVSTWI